MAEDIRVKSKCLADAGGLTKGERELMNNAGGTDVSPEESSPPTAPVDKVCSSESTGAAAMDSLEVAKATVPSISSPTDELSKLQINTSQAGTDSEVSETAMADPDSMMDECGKQSVVAGAAQTDTNSSSSDYSQLQMQMLHRLTFSKATFKSQQRGDPDLTYNDKISLAKDLFENKPVSFMSRFGRHLTVEDLPFLRLIKGDFMIDHYIKEVESKCDDKKNKVRIQNRRYEAMKELEKGGEYFGDEAMKSRDPLLYEQLVGQYLTEEQQEAKVDRSDLRFSTILVKHMDILANNTVYNLQKDYEDAQMEESDEDEEDEMQCDAEQAEAEEEYKPPDISEAEQRLLREELVRTMQCRFLHGEDKEFDYSTVDDNVEYDSLDIREYDEQEKYFDDDLDGEDSYFDDD